MGESLWADLDEWQVEQIKAAVGEDSAYITHVVKTVRAVMIEGVQDFDDDSYWEFPAVAVMSQNALREFGGHGEGGLSFDITYPYFWLTITTGEQEEATRAAKIISKRLETLARQMSTTALPADDSGELQQGIMQVGSTAMAQHRRPRMEDQISRRQGQNRALSNYDHWYILSSLAIGFESSV